MATPRGLAPTETGKVRDIYDLDDRLLLVATDRISAFDVILPDQIPLKGKVLTGLSLFWFEQLDDIVPNHFLSTDLGTLPPGFEEYRDWFAGRSMIVKKADVFPVECIVRGYISGSGWADYQKTGSICGHELREDLLESEQLDEPIFTPSTKATIGHDVNISREELADLVGVEYGFKLEQRSLALYRAAATHAAARGIIIADTKFEFGMIEGQVHVVDEVLTPDSSRFWPADDYEPGRAQRSFDKQFVRDWLIDVGWDKHPPAPKMPDEIKRRTSEKYVQAYEMITGQAFKPKGR